MMMFADPKEWWLELSPTVQADAVSQSRPCSTPNSRHTAYLNSVCLKGFLNWLREDVSAASPWPALPELVSLWDVVNGTAITIGTTRLVLIPTEAIDDGELAVPQEWVDIPSWVGDYYLAVQVQPESGWIRVWGYATHQDLKSNGRYDSIDRTYSLAAADLTKDLNAFWATYQFCGAQQTRSAVAPLPELSAAQAENLVQRLGNSSILFPRLAVPFSLWGALLEQKTWQQQLFQRRTGTTPAIGTATRLGEWLRGNITAAWQSLDAALSPQQTAIAWRSNAALQPSIFEIRQFKVLEFGPQPGDEQVALVIGLTPIFRSAN